MTDPITALHYTANGNFLNGVYAPGADGFNLADVGSVSELNALPPGVKGLFTLVSPTEPTLIFKPPSAPSSAIRTFMASTSLMSRDRALRPI